MRVANNRRTVHRAITADSQQVLGKSPTRTRAYITHIEEAGGTVWLFEQQHQGAIGTEGVPLDYGDTVEVLDRDAVWAISSDGATVAVTELTE